MQRLLTWSRRVAGAALAIAAVGTLALGASVANAADHRDGDGVKEADNIAADINDVYAFVDNDKVVLAMTVFPAADTTAKFSDAAVYVFHVSKHPAFPSASAGSTDVLCTFDAAQTAQCWIGDDEYVTGDADVATGIDSASGKVKLFAGLRADPFFFYLDGFNQAQAAVQNAFPTLSLNPNRCPVIDAGTGAVLRDLLVAADPSADFFDQLNTLAIVIQADKDLFVDANNPIMSVYASTHVKQ